MNYSFAARMDNAHRSFIREILKVTENPEVISFDLFEYASKLKVAFVPGRAFYVDGGGENTLRLNFSNTDETRIAEGIKRLAQATKELLANSR